MSVSYYLCIDRLKVLSVCSGSLQLGSPSVGAVVCTLCAKMCVISTGYTVLFHGMFIPCVYALRRLVHRPWHASFCTMGVFCIQIEVLNSAAVPLAHQSSSTSIICATTKHVNHQRFHFDLSRRKCEYMLVA